MVFWSDPEARCWKGDRNPEGRRSTPLFSMGSFQSAPSSNQLWFSFSRTGGIRLHGLGWDSNPIVRCFPTEFNRNRVIKLFWNYGKSAFMAIGPTTYFKMKKTVFLHQGVLGLWAFDGKSARSFFEEEWSQVDDSGGGAQPWMENIKTVIALPFSK